MTKPCGRPVLAAHSPTGEPTTCSYRRMKGKQRCVWHWLPSQPRGDQAAYAADRRERQLGHDNAVFQARVPAEKWPPGERWCAGCQSFVPLFYTTGSRCRSCASEAAHATRVQSVYGISKDDYEALLRFQGGRCYICRRLPKGMRLAVDHDHATGEVRGLLCANNENGCNRGVVAILESAADGGLAAARRAVEYLEHTPFDRMRGLPARERVVGGLREAPRPQETPPPF